jgi:hypothetical protein
MAAALLDDPERYDRLPDFLDDEPSSIDEELPF